MPNLTIDSPAADGTVSMYFFNVYGLGNPFAASPAALEMDEPDAPLYYRVRCDLFKAGETTLVASIHECPFVTDDELESTTWHAAFFPLQVMMGAVLKATLFLRGEAVAVTAITIDVTDSLPSLPIGIGGGSPPTPPAAPVEPPPLR